MKISQQLPHRHPKNNGGRATVYTLPSKQQQKVPFKNMDAWKT